MRIQFDRVIVGFIVGGNCIFFSCINLLLIAKDVFLHLWHGEFDTVLPISFWVWFSIGIVGVIVFIWSAVTCEERAAKIKGGTNNE
jgi:hypothetical protein